MNTDEGLSDELFGRFSRLLHAQTGIALKDYKKYLVISRLSSSVGPGKPHASYESLFEALQSGSDPALLQSFINSLTTNYSFFFRDPIHFDVMSQYLKERGGREPFLRFWSAASSTGEEAYSMAMTLDRYRGDLPSDRRILATDISTKVLAAARQGLYNADAIEKHVAADDVRRYLEPVDGRFRVNDRLKAFVDFRQLNLQAPFPFRKPMDIVFLRNVMIYFGPQEKADLVDRVYQALKPGGLMFVGLSESLAGTGHRFRTYRESVYMKAGG